MRKQRNAVRAGLFILASIALIILVIVAISGMSRFTQHFNKYVVTFAMADDLGGLRVGDDVRLGGLKVGSVTKIEVHEPANVDVTVELPARFSLADNADVAVQKGLTGAADINITNMGTGTAITDGGSLHGRPDGLAVLMVNLATASAKLNSDLDKFGNTADTATATVQDLRQRLPLFQQRYTDLVDTATKMLNAVYDFIGPSAGDFHTTLANFAKISDDINQRLPGLLDQVHDILATANTTMTHAESAMEDIQATAAHAKELSASTASLIADNRSKLDGFITSLRDASDNLKYATIEIRHSPWRLLYQPKPGEMDNLNIYDSVRLFAQGANDLNDAAGALRDSLNDKNADPEQVKKLMAQLDDSFAKFQKVQEALWKDIKD
jgi:ABC-type transporter Mla subunit MlaD